MRVSNAPTFGAGGGNFFIETPFGIASTGGTISKAGSVASFKLAGFDAWTSNDQGNTFKAGVNVQFTGNVLGGGTVTQTFTINPTGNAGTQWHFGLTFNSTFQAASLTSLQVTILGTGNAANYIALDNIVFSSTSLLPVQLTQFTATNEGLKNSLAWTTASEVNNKGFEIERSQNSADFYAIGNIKAQGKAANYTFTDFTPLTGTNYYRLKAVDNDGSFQYSKTVAVETSKGKKNIKVFPTNTDGIVNIQNDDLSVPQVSVFNAIGQLIFTRKSTNRVDLSTLTAGMYLIEVHTSNGKVMEKVFKR